MIQEYFFLFQLSQNQGQDTFTRLTTKGYLFYELVTLMGFLGEIMFRLERRHGTYLADMNARQPVSFLCENKLEFILIGVRLFCSIS